MWTYSDNVQDKYKTIMSKTYNHYIDGKLVATYPQNDKRRLTLKEQIQRAKRARTDARLVRILTK